MNKSQTVRSTTLAVIACLILVSLPLGGHAATNTWTTNSDFQTWTHSNTEAVNNSIRLAATTTTSSVVSSSLVSPLHSMSAALNPVTNKVYVFGGSDASSADLIQEYNPSTNVVTVKTAKLPSQRQGTAAVWSTATNKFYIFGGDYSSTLYAQILEYDPTADTLAVKSATLPTARFNTSAVWGASQNKIYIFGGDDTEGDASTQILEYDPSTDSLTVKSTVLPSSRSGTSAVWNTSDNKAYIFGGWDNLANAQNTIYAYDPVANTLTVKSATLPDVLAESAAVWDTVNSKAYIYGGTDGASQTNKIYEYVPSSDTASVRSETLPMTAGYMAATYSATAQKAYVVGGVDLNANTTYNSILEHAISSATITTKTLALPARLRGASSVVSPTTNKAYFFGGKKGAAVTNEILEYDITGGMVTTKTATLTDPVEGSAAVWASNTNKAYIFGGYYTKNIMEYDPATDTLTLKSAQLPSETELGTAVWSPTQNKAYFFGGWDYDSVSGMSNKIYEYDPVADTLTAKTATLPTGIAEASAIWSTVNNKAYIFGGYDDFNFAELGSIVEYDPAADAVQTKSATLPSAASKTAAVWDETNGKAYVFGGLQNTTSYDTIVSYDPSVDSLTTNAAVLPTGRNYAMSVWSEVDDKVYVLGGVVAGGSTNQIITFDPGSVTYETDGEAHVAYSPSAATKDWQNIAVTSTANGQTVLAEYTSDMNCSSGWVSTATLLSDSAGICIRVSLSTTNTSVTPIVDDIVVTYGLVTASPSSVPTASPTPTPSTNLSGSTTHTWQTTDDFAAWIHDGTIPINNAVELKQSQGDPGINEVYGSIGRNLGTPGAAYDPASQMIYLFSGGTGYTHTSNAIVSYNVVSQATVKKQATFPYATYGPHVVWDSHRSKAYIFASPPGDSVTHDIFTYSPSSDVLTRKTVALPLDPQISNWTVEDVVWNEQGNVAYLVVSGSYDNNTKTMMRVIAYDPSADTLALLPGTLPYQIEGFSAVYASQLNKIYILGATAYANGSHGIVSYDVGNGTFTEESDVLSTVPRHDFSAVWDAQRQKVYVFGGREGTILGSGLLNEIIAYSPTAHSVTTLNVDLSPYTSGREVTTAIWNATNGHSYVIGGSDQAGISSDVLEFNPDAESIASSGVYSARRATSSVLNDTTDKIYTFGGIGEAGYYDQILEYDPYANITAVKRATLPSQRAYTSAVWDSVHKKAYIFGGLNITWDPSGGTTGTTSYSNQIVEYDPETDTTRMMNAVLPASRAYTAAVWDTDQNRAYILGGYGASGAVNEIVSYDPSADTVATVSTGLSSRPYRSAAVWNPTNKTIYLFVGSTGVSSNVQVISYVPSTDTLSNKTATFPSQRNTFSAVWNGKSGKAYIFGGLISNVTTNATYEYDPVNDSMQSFAAPLTQALASTSAVWVASQDRTYVIGGEDNNGTSVSTIDAQNVSGIRYATTGTAKIVYTPIDGQYNEWKGTNVTVDTPAGQEIETQYSANPSCASGFVSDVTQLAPSESVCIKVTFSSVIDSCACSHLNKVTIGYDIINKGAGTAGVLPKAGKEQQSLRFEGKSYTDLLHATRRWFADLAIRQPSAL